MRQFRILVVLLLVVTACGDDSADPTTGATTLPPQTTAPTPAPTSSTVPAATTTGAPSTSTTTTPTTVATTTTTTTTIPGSTFTSADHGFFPAPLGTADDGHGSGCVLAGDVLTDGMWFGWIETIGGGSVTFDLGCFFTGAAAVAAAAADGDPNFDLDFYLRNQNPKTFDVPLDPSGTAYWLDATGDLTPLAIPITSWPMPNPPSYQACPAEFCSVWLYVNGGMVTELIEQYLP